MKNWLIISLLTMTGKKFEVEKYDLHQDNYYLPFAAPQI